MRLRDILSLCRAVSIGALLPGAAMAANVGVVPKKLTVVDKLSAVGKAKAVFVAKDAAVTKGNGTDPEQIRVEFDVVYGNGSAAGAFTIPAGTAAGWMANRDTVAKYVNKGAPSGPTGVKIAVIQPETLLKLVGKTLGDTPLDILGAGDPGAGGVQTAYCVTNGLEEHCHCSAFTGCVYTSIAGGTGAKLVCKTGTGDAACSAAEPSTTTSITSSTTSTTVVPGCYIDTGLTVIDTCNALEWEKKETAFGSGVDAGNLHDVDNRYTWAGHCMGSIALCQPNAAAAATCTAQTGGPGCAECGGGVPCNVDPSGHGAITTIWDWVNQVNAASFAGHADWRLATSGGSGQPAELESIVDAGAPGCGGGSPCIDPIFGPTALALPYWSASNFIPLTEFAWGVSFADSTGNVNFGGKSTGAFVRAVRPSP